MRLSNRLGNRPLLHVVTFYAYLKLFRRPALLLLGLLGLGTAGYVWLEDYRLLEGVYMTVITVTTVGFGEVRPLSDNGRIFTIFLLLGGVLFYGLALNAIFQTMLQRSFRGIMNMQALRDKLKSVNGHFIICGGGRMALAICSELEKTGQDFVVIEKNDESPVTKLIREHNVPWTILSGDALAEETLQEARLDRARGLFCVLPTDADNLFVVLSARRLNPTIWIETRISHESTRPKMLQAGANRVLSPYHVAGIQMARSMLKPQVDDFIEIFHREKHFEFEARIHAVTAGDPAVGKRVGECRFLEQGFTVVALQKPDGTMLYAPPADTVIASGMAVFLLGKGRQ